MANKVLSERIADEIFNMITVEKRFAPGDRLPNEKEFATELNISRTTFREAAKQLAERGVLEIKRGNGTFVSPNVENFGGIKMETMMADPMDVLDLVEIRLLLEPEMAYLAASRATESEIKRICTYGKQLEEVILKGEDKSELERKFHMSIAQSVHNSFIDKLMPVLFIAIGQTTARFWENKELNKLAIEDHRTIMEYIKNRDGDGARTVMKFHILRGVRDLKQRM
ncbi:MAG: FadR/GntR family transcriptional regulator [Anaerotignaceae bacterium]